MSQIVAKLKAIITKVNYLTDNYRLNLQLSNKQHPPSSDNIDTSNSNNLPHGELSQLIQDFDKMNTEEIDKSILFKKDLSTVTDELVNLISRR